MADIVYSHPIEHEGSHEPPAEVGLMLVGPIERNNSAFGERLERVYMAIGAELIGRGLEAHTLIKSAQSWGERLLKTAQGFIE